MESLDKHIKTRVKLEAFDTKLLTEACKSLIEGISSINGIAKGPIPVSYTHLTLPTIYSV